MIQKDAGRAHVKRNMDCKERGVGYNPDPPIAPAQSMGHIPANMVLAVAQQEIVNAMQLLSQRAPAADAVNDQLGVMKGLERHLRDLPKKGPAVEKILQQVSALVQQLEEKYRALAQDSALPPAKAKGRKKPKPKPDADAGKAVEAAVKEPDQKPEKEQKPQQKSGGLSKQKKEEKNEKKEFER